MEKKVDSFQDLRVGDELYVVLNSPYYSVPWGDDDCTINITYPYGVYRLPISELHVIKRVGTTGVLITYDMSGLSEKDKAAVKDTKVFSIATYDNATLKRCGRAGLDFSAKKVGAENMYHEAKVKALKETKKIKNVLKNKIKRAEEKLKMYVMSLAIVEENYNMLSEN